MALSRRFRALKPWIMFKLRGVDAYRSAIADNIAVREYLGARIAAEDELELLSSGLSVSCFRYRPPGMDAQTQDASEQAALELDRISAAIQRRLLDTVEIILCPTTIDGCYSLRICIVNFRTRRQDIDWLVERVLAFGRQTLADV